MPPTAPPAPAPTERVPFKPPSPRMGGLVQLDEYKWAAWTGGKPLADWSVLGFSPKTRWRNLQLIE